MAYMTLRYETLEKAIRPHVFDFNCGYIGTGSRSNIWRYEKPTTVYHDIYAVQSGEHYFLTLGYNVGTNFRVVFTTTDVSTLTSGAVTGTAVYGSVSDSPEANASVTYEPIENGYLIVQKDDMGQQGIVTSLYNSPKFLHPLTLFGDDVDWNYYNNDDGTFCLEYDTASEIAIKTIIAKINDCLVPTKRVSEAIPMWKY